MSTSCTVILNTEITVSFTRSSLRMMLTTKGMMSNNEHKNNEIYEILGVCIVLWYWYDLRAWHLEPVTVVGD